jgi:hypothetical protein
MLAVGAESLGDVNAVGQFSNTFLDGAVIKRVRLNVFDNLGEVVISYLVVFVPRSELKKVCRSGIVSKMFLDDSMLCRMALVSISHRYKVGETDVGSLRSLDSVDVRST